MRSARPAEAIHRNIGVHAIIRQRNAARIARPCRSGGWQPLDVAAGPATSEVQSIR